MIYNIYKILPRKKLRLKLSCTFEDFLATNKRRNGKNMENYSMIFDLLKPDVFFFSLLLHMALAAIHFHRVYNFLLSMFD